MYERWCKACRLLPVPGDPHVKCLVHSNCFKRLAFKPSDCSACRQLFRRAGAGNEFARIVWRKRLARMKIKRRDSILIPSYKARFLFDSDEDVALYNPLWARVNKRGVKGATRRREVSPALFQQYDDADAGDAPYDAEETDQTPARSRRSREGTMDLNSATGRVSSRLSAAEDRPSRSRRSARPPVEGFVPPYHKEAEEHRFLNDLRPPCLDESDDESYNVPCLCQRDTCSSHVSSSATASSSSGVLGSRLYSRDTCSSQARSSSATASSSSGVLGSRIYSRLDGRRVLEDGDRASAQGTCDSNVCDIVCQKLHTLEKNIQQFIATHEVDGPNLTKNVEEFSEGNSIPCMKIRVADCSQPDANEVNSSEPDANEVNSSQPDANEVNSSEASSTAASPHEGCQDWLPFPKDAKVVSISPLVVKFGSALLGQDDIDIRIFGGESFFKILNNSLKVLDFKRASINETSISRLMTLHEHQMREVCGWSAGRDYNEILIEDISQPVSSVVKLAENGTDGDLNMYHKTVSSLVSMESSSEFVEMLQAPKMKSNPFKPDSTVNCGIFSAISVDLRNKEYQQRKLSETSFKTIEGLECAAKILHNFRSFSEGSSSPAEVEAFAKRVGDFLTALAHQQTPLLAHHLSKVFTIRKIMRTELTTEAKPVQMVSRLMSAPLVGKDLFPKHVIEKVLNEKVLNEKVLKSQSKPPEDSKLNLEDLPEVLFDFPLQTITD